MKKAAVLAIVLVTVFSAWAAGDKELSKPNPPRDGATGKVAFREEVQVQGADSKELRARAKAWAATLKTEREAPVTDDESRLVVKPVYPTPGHEVGMTVTIVFKEGAYTYTVTDILSRVTSTSGGSSKPASKGKSVEQFLELIERGDNGRAATQSRIAMVNEWLAAADSCASSLKRVMAAKV